MKSRKSSGLAYVIVLLSITAGLIRLGSANPYFQGGHMLYLQDLNPLKHLFLLKKQARPVTKKAYCLSCCGKLNYLETLKTHVSLSIESRSIGHTQIENNRD